MSDTLWSESAGYPSANWRGLTCGLVGKLIFKMWTGFDILYASYQKIAKIYYFFIHAILIKHPASSIPID